MKKDITLITLKTEVARVDLDIPFVEFIIYNDEPMVVDRYSLDAMPAMKYETYRADIVILREETPHSRTETRMALDKEAKKIVDIFVKHEIKPYLKDIAHWKRLYELEESKTCWDRFIDWSEETLNKWRKR